MESPVKTSEVLVGGGKQYITIGFLMPAAAALVKRATNQDYRSGCWDTVRNSKEEEGELCSSGCQRCCYYRGRVDQSYQLKAATIIVVEHTESSRLDWSIVDGFGVEPIDRTIGIRGSTIDIIAEHLDWEEGMQCLSIRIADIRAVVAAAVAVGMTAERH